MKKYMCLALTLVLTASVLMGCGCTNQKMRETTGPNVLPTNEEVWDSAPSTTPTTTQSTAPSIMTTQPAETMDRGNGPLEDDATGSSGAETATDPTANAGSSARSRSRSGSGAMGSSGSMGGMTGMGGVQ